MFRTKCSFLNNHVTQQTLVAAGLLAVLYAGYKGYKCMKRCSTTVAPDAPVVNVNPPEQSTSEDQSTSSNSTDDVQPDQSQ